MLNAHWQTTWSGIVLFDKCYMYFYVEERICQACLVRLTVISNTVMQYLLTILIFCRHSISRLTHFIGSPLALNVISQHTHAHEPPSILPGLHAQQATTMLIQTQRTKAHCLVCTRYTLSK